MQSPQIIASGNSCGAEVIGVDLAELGALTIAALHQAGKVRILAVNAPRRLKAAPDIPPAVETVPNMIAELFTGLFALAGTPKPVIDRISQATRKALMDTGFQQTLMKSGFEPVLDSSPEKAQRYVNEAHDRLIPLVKAIGVAAALKLITFPTIRRSRIDHHICSRKAASPGSAVRCSWSAFNRHWWSIRSRRQQPRIRRA